MLLEEKHQKKRRNQLKFNIFYNNFQNWYRYKPLPFDYISKDDDKDYISETEHKISLLKLNNEIANILMNP